MSDCKFTMELVWHDCDKNPPSEERNSFLLVTDGRSLWSASYKDRRFNLTPLKLDCDHAPGNKKWWADPYRTIGGCEQFEGERRYGYELTLTVGVNCVVEASNYEQAMEWANSLTSTEVGELIMHDPSGAVIVESVSPVGEAEVAARGGIVI